MKETPEQKKARSIAQLRQHRAEGGDKHRFDRQEINPTLDDALFEDFDAPWKLQREKPVHRRMIELSLQGYSTQEIANATNYKPKSVAGILRQPWARERIIKTVKKTVSDEIKELLEAEAIPALKVLKEVAHNPAARTSDRLTASNALLDRFLGKPVQPISNDQTPPSEMTDEELRKQIERELTTSQPN